MRYKDITIGETYALRRKKTTDVIRVLVVDNSKIFNPNGPNRDGYLVELNVGSYTNRWQVLPRELISTWSDYKANQ